MSMSDVNLKLDISFHCFVYVSCLSFYILCSTNSFKMELSTFEGKYKIKYAFACKEILTGKCLLLP